MTRQIMSAFAAPIALAAALPLAAGSAAAADVTIAAEGPVVELRASLFEGDKALSETWVYRWTP